MGLDLGTLSARIEIRDDGVTSKLSRVKSQLSEVDKAAQNVGRSKIDITPKGAGDLDKAKSSAQNLGRELGTASSAAQRMTVPTQAASELDRAATSGGRLRSVIGALSDVAPIVGVGAAAGGVAAGFQAALKIGNEYTNELNTMNAVSGATESQMRQISQAARELGNDTSLANVSASDAAAAMTELAKGGMSVDQAMAAAKGTLQLSAAASIDAASAATIQSQALQAFGLNADYAAKASDVLANAANASSAEITGIAQGLQQSGAVANQFGLSLEDTSASLAMLANAGIQGSDAGTLLKSTLLALTDQGAPAQAAMEELGLTVYDAQGKFVGMSSLMGQLEQASKSMSDEQYQAATATLFGSDAMRLAGVAAQQGQAGYDKMREAMDRQGAAAEVAAAKTQGLPGAIGKVQNAAEELGLALYDMVDGPLEVGLTSVASGISGIGAAMSNVPAPVFAGGIALVASKILDLNGKATSGVGSIRNFGAAVRENQRFFGQMGREIGMVTSAMVTLEERSPGMHRFANSVRDSAGPLMMMGRESRLAAAEVTGMGRVALLARGHVETLGGVAKGVAGGGLSLLKTGASGLVSFLGGPWGIAIAGATTALGFLAQKHQEAAQEEAEHKAKQSELRDTLDQTTGAITAQTNELQRKRAEESGFLETANQLGIASGVVVDAMNGEKGAIDQVNAAVEAQGTKVLEASDYWQSYKDKFQAAGLNQADVLRAMRGELEEGSDAQKRFLDVSQQINEAEGGAYSGHKKWQEAKDQINGATDAAHKLREGVQGAAADSDAAAQAMQRMARESVLGGDKMTQAMGLLGDTIVALPDEKTIQVSSMAPEVKTQLEELGAKVERLPDGKVNVQFPDGMNIVQMLDELGAKTKQLPDGRVDVSDNAPEVQQRLVDLGVAVRDEKTGKVVLKDNISDVIKKQQDLKLNVASPIDGQLFVKDNIGAVRGQLAGLGIQTKQLPPGQVRILDNAPQVQGKLEALGVKTVTLPGGRVAIWDNTPETQAHLDAVGAKTSALPPGWVQITDTSDENIKRLESLGVKTTTLPDGRVVITENADAVANKIRTTLSAERTNTFSEHVINITRRITDIFTNSEGNFIPSVQRFADGGETAINRAMQGKHTEPPHTAHIAPAGAWRLFAEPETGGEAYIPLAASKRQRSEKILSQVAQKFGYQLMNRQGQVQQFADGGLTEWARQNLDGDPYVWGGHGPDGSDCSGFVSINVNKATGRDPYGERASTANMREFLTSRGALDGMGEPGDLRIGWVNGGPGGGHTALTYPDGTKGESGGSHGNVAVGGPAVGHDDPQFVEHMYIPRELLIEGIGNAGLDDYAGLSGVVGGGNTPAGATAPTDGGSASEPTKKINGGNGTLIKDGSFLELVAAAHSKATGAKYQDDIVSWGQLAGLYTEIEQNADAAGNSVEGAASKISNANDEIGAFDGLTDNLPNATTGNHVADAIIREGRRRGITDRGIQIALATALVESNMRNLANPADPVSMTMPHDGVGYDHDSVGVFQQRNNGAWGTTADRMDPARSAGMFYDRLDDANYNEGDPGAHAQRVQGSAFPDRYGQRMAEAAEIMARYNATPAKVTAMADGGIMGNARQAQINEGSSAVLWAEAGPEAYIPLSRNKRARAVDVWMETGKRLGINAMGMVNLIGSTLPGLAEGNLEMSTGSSLSLDALGLNLDAAAYRGGRAIGGNPQAQQAVGAIFNGPVQINDPRQLLQGQLNNSTNALRMAMRSVGM